MVIADRLAVVTGTAFSNYESYEGFTLFFCAVLYAVQIYTDFAGYSEMAIGLAHMLGFRIPANFERPYFASSIHSFWRRWHISLTSWFREYLYFPLGGSRKGHFRKYINILIIFLVSGLWHGAGYQFIIWGLLHGIYQIVGQLFAPAKISLYRKLHFRTETYSFRVLKILIVFLLVDFAWIFFAQDSLSSSLGFIHNMLSSFNPWIFTDGTLYTLGLSAHELFIGLAACVVLYFVSYQREKGNFLIRFLAQPVGVRWTTYLCLIFSIFLFGMYGPSYSPAQFIYAGF